jgi:hypothetical protein
VGVVGQGIWRRRTYGKLQGLYTDVNIVADTEKKKLMGVASWKGCLENIWVSQKEKE